MNTDYQKPPLAPKPKILSRLSIKLPSSLMSRPCSSARGPKPPVAPKPRLQEETDGPNANSGIGTCTNGDLPCSEEEIDQDNEFGDILAVDKRYFLFSTNHLADFTESCVDEEVEQTVEFLSDGQALCSNNNEAEEELAEREVESMDSADTDSTDSVDGVDISDVDSGGDLADGVEISDIECGDDNTPEDYDAGEALADTEGLSECDVASNNEGSPESLCETGEESCLTEEDENTAGVPPNGRGISVEQLHSLEEESCFRILCVSNFRIRSIEEDVTSGTECSTFGGTPNEAEYVNSCVPLRPHEEYPYDVIGPPCDSQLPERSEDFFQPYSVIDSVPGSYTASVTDFLAKCDEENANKRINISEDQAAANLEPYYVSSNDVADIEDNQEHAEEDMNLKAPDLPHSLLAPCEKPRICRDKEDVDDYADIDDSFCKDPDDLQHLEGASSEDYVEIGDDEEEETNKQLRDKAKKAKDCEPASKQCQTLLSQLNSHSHFRLCSITVPANLDSGRSSELTNRLVLADTTDAFQEEIDFDGHIVPYYEGSDSERDNISDEHVYEEAGLDSEGENFLSLERKCMVTRSRSLSCKMPGYVPETVPEETGSEYQTHDYCTVALDKSRDPSIDSEKAEATQMFPSSKPRHFVLYPRSYSVEGRDVPMSVYAEGSLAGQAQMKRKDDNLSLPCVIASSGSFSQRGLHPSSGMSTPTSVEIPPPFELAYITKKPITKSSPSLLIESDSSEKPKKKKSSFKRFLALKFKRKTESKAHVDVSIPSSRSSSESSHHGPLRVLEIDRRSMSSSPQLQSRSGMPHRSSDVPSTFILYKDGPRRKVDTKAFGNRSVLRVESFEDRSRPPLMPLPLTKPRSISFPNTDTSDYENIPAMSSDYENIQIQPQRPARAGTIGEYFDDPNQAPSSANETDGYVDMSSFTGFESKPQTPDQESKSAYTEPCRACPSAPRPSGEAMGESAGEEDHGRTSEEEDGCAEYNYDKQIDGRSRAFYIAKGLMDSEKLHVKGLKMLHEDFRAAVAAAVGEDGDPVLVPGRLGEILGQLPQVYELHCNILMDLEARLRQWEESQKIADVILSRRKDFIIFTTYISEYDRSMALLDESCQNSPTFASIVKQFEEKPAGESVPLKHQLLQVVVRVLQYRMLLTDYLNNLSPDSAEYEDTQAALAIVSDVSDQANDNLKQGENLLRLVHIEYSIRGQRDVLRPGRVFVKEGTLMKVSRKSRQPRHLFLMNDVMLYTFPQQDGKYRLKNTLSLTGMKVSKPTIENVQNTLKIEVNDISITLSASSYGEREDWFHTLIRTVADQTRPPGSFSSYSSEAREKLWMCLGEKAPPLVPVSHVMMCMNCTSDFSLTLRRHHCHACGKIVCRSCSRNKYPLKYLKDRVAKVCDRCYAELRKRGGVITGVDNNGSPRPNQSSRPLSAVFQSIHPPSLWKPRKSTSALNQVSGSAEGSAMSGSLLRCKRSKRNWKKLWFLIKDKVLYTFTTCEDKVASESLPLLGFTVQLPEKVEGVDAANVFQLYHKKTLFYTFRAEDTNTALRWVNAIEEATVL